MKTEVRFLLAIFLMLGVLVGTYSSPRSSSSDIRPQTLAWPVNRFDPFSHVSAPNASFDCGTV